MRSLYSLSPNTCVYVCVCVVERVARRAFGTSLASGCKMIFLSVRDRGNLTFVRGLAEIQFLLLALSLSKGKEYFVGNSLIPIQLSCKRRNGSVKNFSRLKTPIVIHGTVKAL
jgi:hypothetical protein